jgi:hypothetical protein
MPWPGVRRRLGRAPSVRRAGGGRVDDRDAPILDGLAIHYRGPQYAICLANSYNNEVCSNDPQRASY